MAIIKCDGCGKDLTKTVFCSPTCRVRHWRRKKDPSLIFPPENERSEEKSEPEETVPTIIFSDKKGFNFTKCSKHHGVYKGSCGCK